MSPALTQWVKDLALLCVAALIHPLGWELPYAVGVALKRKKKKRERERNRTLIFWATHFWADGGVCQTPKWKCVNRQLDSSGKGSGWKGQCGNFLACLLSCLLSFLLACFFRASLRHMEVPGLQVKPELQLLACSTATAMPDPSRACKPHHSSQQCQIPHPLSKAWDRAHVLMDASQIC